MDFRHYSFRYYEVLHSLNQHGASNHFQAPPWNTQDTIVTKANFLSSWSLHCSWKHRQLVSKQIFNIFSGYLRVSSKYPHRVGIISMFYTHRNSKAADSEVICPRELRSWNAAQPVVFFIPNINQNFQRGAVKERVFIQVKQFSNGKHSLG